MVIISSEGCQEGNPVLMAILSQIRRLDNQCGPFAIHDDITAVVPTSVASEVYDIVAQELSSISILAVPTKSHLYTAVWNSWVQLLGLKNF